MKNGTIVEFCEENWPSNIGLLSNYLNEVGNEKNRKHIHNVIVLSPQFSMVTVTTAHLDGTTYNCICVPLNDIENVLINSRFDLKGTLLQLFTESKVIKQTNIELLSLIKNRASELYRKENYEISTLHKNAIKRLVTLQSAFSLTLSQFEKFLVINDIVTAITEAEATKYSNWLLAGHGKASVIYAQSPNLMDSLMQAANKATTSQDLDQFLELKTFLEYYNQTMRSSITAGNLSEDIKNYAKQIVPSVFGIDFGDGSIGEFVKTVIAAIKEDELLGSYFEYFHVSPKNKTNIFNASLTAYFRASDEELNTKLHLQLKKVLEPALKKRLNITFLPTEYLMDRSINKGFLTDFAGIAKEISNLNLNYVLKYGDQDKEKSFFISIIIITNLVKLLDLSVEDTLKGNFYLSIRYMFKRREQTENASEEAMAAIRNKKYEIYTRYYLDNKETISLLFDKGLAINESQVDKEYSKIIIMIRNYISSQDGNFEFIINQNIITASVLKDIYQIEEVGKVLTYTLLYEYIMLLFNLESQQSCLCSFVISEAILDKKNKIIQN